MSIWLNSGSSILTWETGWRTSVRGSLADHPKTPDSPHLCHHSQIGWRHPLVLLCGIRPHPAPRFRRAGSTFLKLSKVALHVAAWAFVFSGRQPPTTTTKAIVPGPPPTDPMESTPAVTTTKAALLPSPTVMDRSRSGRTEISRWAPARPPLPPVSRPIPNSPLSGLGASAFHRQGVEDPGD